MRTILSTFRLLLVVGSVAAAQGASAPLRLQGTDQSLVHDVRSLGMGGAVTASGNNAAVLFSNPAGLGRIRVPEFRVNGDVSTLLQKHTQKWVPNRYFTGLSLMMEDSWGDIKAP
ncbi:MAG: hypothetical protein HUU02_16910, partial [Bacteroidetes bacterium]|nr:hypothetical protein [Bacteroidota bacterium]